VPVSVVLISLVSGDSQRAGAKSGIASTMVFTVSGVMTSRLSLLSRQARKTLACLTCCVRILLVES